MELVAFGSMIALILYLLIANYNGNLGIILPIFSVYALGTFKLLPAFQQIYASIAIIKGNIASFTSIQRDLLDSDKKEDINTNYTNSKFMIRKKISLNNISFTYPEKSEKHSIMSA